MRVVLLGPPGSGKGTQGELLSAAAGVPHVSTGAMLREAADAGDPVGLEARDTIARGGFVTDAVALALVERRLGMPDASRGFVLDGFPRTAAQAVALDGLLERLGTPLDAAVELHVSTERLLARVLARRDADIAAGRRPRDDDTPETLAARVATYEELTAPVAGHYARAGLLATVDGTMPMGDVARAVLAAARHGETS